MIELLANKYFLWTSFNILVLAMIALDLGVFHKKDHEISIKEAVIWSIIWIVVALIFNVGVYFWKGSEVAMQFFTGYVIERTLSIDNIFVFLMIFTYFQVPAKFQYKVLIWGILGALILRGIFILLGAFLISKFHWVLYIFGAFLVITGIRMGFGHDKEIEPEKNPVLRLVRKILPISKSYSDGKFFHRENGLLLGSPLLVVLVVVETTDVVFALDSIPAIFGITLDPFIVYSSNVFAILGLRALYFAMAGMMKLFHYLKYALSIILALIGVKMLLSSVVHVPNGIALGSVGALLLLSILLSIMFPPKKSGKEQSSSEEIDMKAGKVAGKTGE